MDYYLGQILLLPYSFAPVYTANCDGAILTISGNEALFSLLGANYGGNGQTTFGLPDLRGAEPLPGMRYCIVTRGMYPQRP